MDKRWLSQLLNDSAFPVLALAIAVSQVRIGQDKNDVMHQRGRQSSEVQADNGFRHSTDKYGSRTATESSPTREKIGPDKESAQNH
jgi:hypothetical protein